MSVRVYTTNGALQDTDANFRIWGKALSDALTAAGCVQTADTGQIDWATVLKPALSSTWQGFEIRHFSDALQPALIKIEYGAGAGAATNPGCRVSVGTTTNGAGVFTGFIIETILMPRPPIASGTTAYNMVVGGPDRLLIALNFRNFDSTQTGGLFAVERTRDAAGNATNEGLCSLVTTYGGTVSFQYFYTFVGGQISKDTSWSGLMPSVGSGSTGMQTMVFPLFSTKGTFVNPMTVVMMIFTENCTSYVPFSVTLLGSSKLYFPIPVTTYYISVRGITYVYRISILVRFD
jgi:hypothetical protein